MWLRGRRRRRRSERNSCSFGREAIKIITTKFKYALSILRTTLEFAETIYATICNNAKCSSVRTGRQHLAKQGRVRTAHTRNWICLTWPERVHINKFFTLMRSSGSCCYDRPNSCAHARVFVHIVVCRLIYIYSICCRMDRNDRLVHSKVTRERYVVAVQHSMFHPWHARAHT